MPRPLVILPTFNERENLVPLVGEIRSYLPEATIWVVDDNSPDGTGKIADHLASDDPLIDVIHRPGKLGLGTAYVTAFRRALREEFDYIIQMDVDFSHHPKYLPAMVAAAAGADVVVGSRYVDGGGTLNWPWTRRALSRLGNAVARAGLSLRTRDTTGGYRLFHRSTLKELELERLNLRGYGFMIEVLYQLQARGKVIREVPIVFVERTAGESKMSAAIALEAFLYILRRRLRRPMRKAGTPGRAAMARDNGSVRRTATTLG